MQLRPRSMEPVATTADAHGSPDSSFIGKFVICSLNRANPKFSISNKICWGYGVSLGIAVLGTSIGLVLGSYYYQQARTQLASANRQEELLHHLQITVAEFRPEREFTPVLRNPSRFQTARAEFLQRVEDVHTLINELQSFALVHHSAELHPFLQAFQIEVENYTQQLEAILSQIDPTALEAKDVERLRGQLIRFIDNPTYLSLFRYSDELNTLIADAEQQNRLAEAALDRAEVLRIQVIILSMLLSIIIAAVLAVYTSHAIARPIKAVTKVAQDVTEKGDFSLRASVITQDEVACLTQSLNQLIEWIARYTKNLHATQTQLIQTEKMSSLEQMVAGIAHEVNNPISFIYGNLDHIKTYTEGLLHLIHLYQQHYPQKKLEIQAQIEAIDLDFLSEDFPKLLSSMRAGTDRIRQLVLSLRNFSRLDEADAKLSNLHEGLDNTLLLLSDRLKHNIQVIKNYADLPLIECYPAQINQVFMHVLNNAIDALLASNSPSDRKITIETKLERDQVAIRIQDNGSGISPEIIEKVFDPFFTTKPIGRGTGLGLAICYQIIEQHKGHIVVRSAVNEGTEVVIYLPIQVAAKQVCDSSQNLPELQGDNNASFV